MNKVRSFLFTSKVNKNLWGEALLAATFIYNRTPHKALNYKSPYEIYYKKESNI
jgi:IS30 family transposase